jgi:hypothetical protein
MIKYLVLFLLLATPAFAQQRIGAAHSVKPDATGTIAGTLAPGSGVHAQERIGTGPKGVAGLKFNDQTNLDVGPNSDVKLDKFVYDPNKGKGQIAIEATKGAFRLSTGAQGGDKQIKVKDPHGVLGIRG